MLAAILISTAAFFLKWPSFANPLSGYFGSYQAVNAMMAEMMGGGSLVNLLIPRTFILMDGAPAFHLLYYPIGSLAAFLLDALFGGGVAWWGRFQAGAFVWGATVLLYPIARRFLNTKDAVLSIFFFSFFPMVLLSGVLFQNEAAALFFLILAFWLLDPRVLLKILMSGLALSIALTARIHFLVALPAFLLWLNREKFSFGRTAVFLLGVAAPPAAWIYWIHVLDMQNVTHVQTSLFSQSGEGRFMAASLLGSFGFYRKITTILGTYGCTPVLFPFALFGLFKWRKEYAALLVWLWGSLGLIVLLPQKVVDHPFYLLVGSPALAILTASAVAYIWDRWAFAIKVILCGSFILLAMRYFLPPVLRFEISDRNIPSIGASVRKMTSPEDKIIAQHGTSPDLLYYSGRKGWSFDIQMTPAGFLASKQARHQQLVREGYGDAVFWLEKLRRDGARYLVVSEPVRFHATTRFANYVNSTYSRMPAQDDTFLMFDLEKRNAT